MTRSARPIVVFTSRYGPGCPGGIEAVVTRLIPAIAERRPDWDVRRVFAYAKVTPLSKVPLLTDIISAVRLAFRSRHADLVVVNGGEYAWPRLLSERMRKSTVVVWHGTRFGEIPALRPHLSLPVRLYAWLENALCRLATRLSSQVAVGESVREEVRRGYGYDGQVRVIVNGVDRADSVAPVGRPDRDTLRLIWVGTTPYKKGLDLALQACETAIEAGVSLHLSLLGVDADSITRQPWLDVVGRVSPSEVTERLRDSDVYFAPARYEGCSMACLEAMAAGLPVIGTPIMRWMVAEAGVCSESYEAADLGAIIQRFSRDPAYLARASQEARAIAADFNWDRCATAYVSVLEEVASGLKE